MLFRYFLEKTNFFVYLGIIICGCVYDK